MSTDEILFILRIISGSVLVGILFLLFVLIRRDYRSTSLQSEFRRRSYGQLVKLTRLENQYASTGESYPLQTLTSIGRSPTNTIVLNNSFTSSEHAMVFLKDGQWWLEDRNSRNGTTLNDDRLTSATIITEGDVIGIGDVHFKLVLE